MESADIRWCSGEFGGVCPVRTGGVYESQGSRGEGSAQCEGTKQGQSNNVSQARQTRELLVDTGSIGQGSDSQCGGASSGLNYSTRE